MLFKVSTKTFNNILLLFFIFSSLFISIRLLLIGSDTSQNSYEFLLSALPEIFVLAVVGTFFHLKFKTREKLIIDKTDWIFFFFIISNLIWGMWVGKDLKMGIYGFRMTYLPMCFYYIASFSVLSKFEFVDLIDKIIKWFTIVAGLGILLYFFFYDFSIMMLLKVAPVVPEYFITRMTSIFWSPVVFGTFSTISFLYFYYKSLHSGSYWNYFFQVILFTGTLLSMSRGSMLGLILGVIVLSVLSKKWKKMAVTAGLTITLFIPISFYVDSPISVIKWMFTSTVQTVKMDEDDRRVRINKSSIELIKKRPYGMGLGKAGHVAARFSKSKDHVQDGENLSIASTDGWFVKIACETGLWGLFSYLLFSSILFVSSIKYFRKHEFGFFGFLFTVFIVVNFQNLVSNVLDFYLFSYLYWLLIGYMVLHIKLKEELEIY